MTFSFFRIGSTKLNFFITFKSSWFQRIKSHFFVLKQLVNVIQALATFPEEDAAESSLGNDSESRIDELGTREEDVLFFEDSDNTLLLGIFPAKSREMLKSLKVFQETKGKSLRESKIYRTTRQKEVKREKRRKLGKFKNNQNKSEGKEESLKEWQSKNSNWFNEEDRHNENRHWRD